MMPTPNEISRTRDQYARESDREANRRYTQMSSPLLVRITSLLDGLLTDNLGRLLFNVRNISTVNQIGFAVQAYNERVGFSFLRWMFGRLTRLLGLNREYFGSMPELQPETVEDRVRKLLLIRYGFNPDNNTIDPDGYLAANIRQSQQPQVVAQRINQALAARMNLNQFKREFQRDFMRAGSPLSVDYHYSRFARDIFQEFDRTTQLVYADELGLDHAIYSGTVKNNTRCFCLKRVNRVYTDEFMQTWNNQTWQGKKPGVDVRIALGGFSCRHILSWVTEGTAEAVVKRRKEEKDKYHETEC